MIVQFTQLILFFFQTKSLVGWWWAFGDHIYYPSYWGLWETGESGEFPESTNQDPTRIQPGSNGMMLRHFVSTDSTVFIWAQSLLWCNSWENSGMTIMIFRIFMTILMGKFMIFMIFMIFRILYADMTNMIHILLDVPHNQLSPLSSSLSSYYLQFRNPKKYIPLHCWDPQL